MEILDDLVRELAQERYSETYESCCQGGVPRDFTVEDFMDEAREFVMRAYALGRREVLDAITYTTDDGGIFNAKLDHVDLREYL